MQSKQKIMVSAFHASKPFVGRAKKAIIDLTDDIDLICNLTQRTKQCKHCTTTHLSTHPKPTPDLGGIRKFNQFAECLCHAWSQK